MPSRTAAVAVGAVTALCFSGMAVSGRAISHFGISPFLAIAFRSIFGIAFTTGQLALMPTEKRSEARASVVGSRHIAFFVRGACSFVGQGGSFWAYADGSLSLGVIAALFQTIPL